MKSLRAGWLSFRRIHLAALIADWRRTLLSVIGVALGVTVVLGTLILKSELARPFDAFGPSLTHAADVGVVEVTPNVKRPVADRDGRPAARRGGRGGGGHPDRRRLDARGHRRRQLTGSFCSAGRARSSCWSARSTASSAPATRSPQTAPACHCRFRRSSPNGMAYSSATSCASPACRQVRRTWAGRSRSSTASRASTTATCCWPPRRTSPRACSAHPATPRPRSSCRNRALTSRRDVDRVIAGVATAGPPRPHLPAVFENATQSFNLTVLAGILIGFLIAVNTILLAVEDRRAVMGTIGAIGAKPARVVRRDARRGGRGGCSRRTGWVSRAVSCSGHIWWTDSGSPCWPVPAARSPRTSRRT